MVLECKSMGSYCGLEVFTINGIKAEHDDFGEKYDHNPEFAEEYGCGNMRFEPCAPTDAVLRKYNITEREYGLICDRLVEELAFGRCGGCI